MGAVLALNGLIEGISVGRYHILYFGVFLEIPMLDFNVLSIKPLRNKYFDPNFTHEIFATFYT